MIRRIFLTLTILLTLTTPSFGAVTEEDSKYTQDISAALIDFQQKTTNWGSVSAEQPAKANSPTYKSWKAKFMQASKDMVASVERIEAIKAPATFAKSDPLLRKAMATYKKGVNQLKAAANKNSKKAITAAEKTLVAANKAFVVWQGAYADDVNALNE